MVKSIKAGLFGFIFFLLLMSGGCSMHSAIESNKDRSGRWSQERIWQWYRDVGIIRGCNYLPRTATNSTEMWQKETFDPETIEEEFGWAEKYNYNSVRVFLQYLVWKHDPEGLKQRMDEFMTIADKHGISTMWVFFDDCAFGYPPKKEPYLGKQGDPEAGEYCPYWTPSPGHKIAVDPKAWGDLKKYVRDIVSTFANDKRVIAWDMYNEPGNAGMGDKSLPMAKASFSWARSANPSQPITTYWYAKDDKVYDLCDFMTFHSYSNAASVRDTIQQLQKYDRPVINTEWLLRRDGNTVKEILPVFAEYGIGWYQWGLVAGRTQTFMYWTSKKGDPVPDPWQHDIFHGDGKVYRPEEMELLSNFKYDRDKVDIAANRWSIEKANDWYKDRPWPIGCNFLPSTAVNSTEMWLEESFDPETIDRELRWAKKIGFNTVRVFIQYVVWEADAEGLKKRIYEFLEIANSHGISVMPVLFDDCFKQEPFAGKQPDPIPGVHNSQWTASPGERRRRKNYWPNLERYVLDLVSCFADSKRIIAWDLYNEPKPESIELVEKVFIWARSANPSQPLTVGAFQTTFDDLHAQRYMTLSDIISFHSYDGIETVKEKINVCQKFQRPIICTEYMARSLGSTFKTHLDVFKEKNIGAYNWGLVAGKTQTYMPWGSKEDSHMPEIWFHDIFRKDGTAFDLEEINIIKNIPDQAELNEIEIAPTSLKKPQTWLYTLNKPGTNWESFDYDDSGWQTGKGGFGHKLTPGGIARTEWNTSDVWLRRKFDVDKINASQLYLKIQHDEDAEIFLNGELIAKVVGYNTHYELVTLDDNVLEVIKSGPNVLAVHCHQTYGGQYIDVGMFGTKSE